MTLSNLTKRTLLAGSATLAAAYIALSMSATAQASMTAQEFMASLDDLKQVCHRMDLPLWIKKNESGCGKTVMCQGRRCYYKPILVPTRPEPVGVAALVDDDHGHGGEGKKGGKGREGGGVLR